MKTLFAMCLVLCMTACSADISAPANPFPPSDRKTGGDLPIPTSNAGRFRGQDFVAVKAAVRADGFYSGYYQIRLLPAEASNPCSYTQNKYVEVNVSKNTPEQKFVLDSDGTLAGMGLFYDYANGSNINVQLSNGWFQLSNFAATQGGTITLNINDGTEETFIYGVYPLHKCF